MTDKMMCPRRDEVVNANVRYPKGDYWRDEHGWRICSFCGSLHPEDCLSLLASGTTISPTDKNYKVYLSLPMVHGHQEGKFYFQHFNTEQQIRFIELYNTKPRSFNIGYPYDFYVLPFFVRKAVNSG